MNTGSIDDNILQALDVAGTDCITSIEIENMLRPLHGDTTHQSVTGNLRHLVERNEVYLISEKRMVEGASRQVYVSPKHYSTAIHGVRIINERKSRAGNSENDRMEMRGKVLRSKSGSSHQRILSLFREKSDGLTCHEIEYELGMLHQTASARLAEQNTAGLVRKTGSDRQGTNDNKPQPVYEMTQDGLTATNHLVHAMAS